PQHAIEALLGKNPAKDLSTSGQRSMLERVKWLKDLVVMNDEAHHVHDEDLEWSQSLLAIHRALPKGLALWLDFSATPKDQHGMYYPWTVCDYPLAQAVEDRITKAELDRAREAARDIDKAESKIKAIVSVMMLREGWDVRNVTVVLGLRPFTAKAEILPEQVIGRGLRLMTQVSPDRTQTLEVLDTRNLLKVLRTQLEAEGVGVGSTKTAPAPPVIIEPVKERLSCDITIPIT